MALYSLGTQTVVTTSSAATYELYSGANVGFRLLEFGLTLNAATASAFGLGRCGAASVTPTALALVAEDAGNSAANNTSAAVAWGTAPTVPTSFSRRVAFGASAGAGIVWTFPRGYVCLKGGSGVNGSLVLENLAANSVANVWSVVDE